MQALTALTRFVAAVRGKNPAVPIYLFGEQLSAVALPPPVLKEIHGFVNAFEDSADFVARGIARAAQAYLDALAPPFFKALTDYARRGAYSWHAPGHSGGTAFLKSPVGTMFHEFFGENMLRADVCNAVEELGQLLDHTGPVYDAERNAARIFSADHMYFVTNGTSTSNKIVWSAMVSPGDIVRGRPQLPQVGAARPDPDRRDPHLPDPHPQPASASSAPSRAASSTRPASAPRSRPTRSSGTRPRPRACSP